MRDFRKKNTSDSYLMSDVSLKKAAFIVRMANILTFSSSVSNFKTWRLVDYRSGFRRKPSGVRMT